LQRTLQAKFGGQVMFVWPSQSLLAQSMTHSLFAHPPVHSDGQMPPGGAGVDGQLLLPPAAAVPPVPVAAPPLAVVDEAPPELGPEASVELVGVPAPPEPVALEAASTPRPSKSFVHADVAHVAQSTTLHPHADRRAAPGVLDRRAAPGVLDRGADGNDPIPIGVQGSRAYAA